MPLCHAIFLPKTLFLNFMIAFWLNVKDSNTAEYFKITFYHNSLLYLGIHLE